MYEEDEHIESAEEELKRADHLVFVSLKYTRTVDVMKNAIKRMINAFELAFDDYLETVKKKKQVGEIPLTGKEKAIAVKELLGNPVKKYLILYNLLKKIDKAEYSALEEFRKNVTLRIQNGKEEMNVKMDDLYRFLVGTKEFVSFIKQEQKK